MLTASFRTVWPPGCEAIHFLMSYTTLRTREHSQSGLDDRRKSSARSQSATDSSNTRSHTEPQTQRAQRRCRSVRKEGQADKKTHLRMTSSEPPVRMRSVTCSEWITATQDEHEINNGRPNVTAELGSNQIARKHHDDQQQQVSAGTDLRPRVFRQRVDEIVRNQVSATNAHAG
jgi:hypothetical protein